ncbi:MAG: AAA family ATPase [Acidobacteriota bacterium]|nr:AAA family ATPase [Acidobacteriota bacterium]
MKPLPIGIQTFEKLRTEGYLYVDKTAHLKELVRGGYFFLSRPRRFGKSLLLSTLESLFKGSRDLFKGLDIANTGYDFAEYPVIRLDFSAISSESPETLERDLRVKLSRFAKQAGVQLPEDASLAIYVEELILALSSKAPLVILVDEYDKPILDHLAEPDLAEANRKLLREFYGVIKSQDAHIKMLFITGITRFTKVSIFSELNNLVDLSINPDQATLLGWTEEELHGAFKEYIIALAERSHKQPEDIYRVFGEMYNGYRFTHIDQKVYNPWSVLNALLHGRIGNFWYESGSPRFLMNELKKRLNQPGDFQPGRFYDFSVSADMLPALDIRNADLETLLFQAGYLTILRTSGDLEDLKFHMGFPNREVRMSWLFTVLKSLVPLEDHRRDDHLTKLVNNLRTGDLDAFFERLRSAFFANIPYELHLPYEKYYQTVFHTLFLLLAVRIRSEESTNLGRTDCVFELEDRIYIFEFKYNDTAESALQQIHEKDYTQGYAASGKRVISVGVGFANRNISGWLVENL